MSAEFKRTGILCVVSGPSGSGKTSLCRAVSERGVCEYAVSATTRQARAGERDGVDYFFLSEEEFEHREANREFLEHAVVHGHRYGTLRQNVVEKLEQGVDVIMDIDVQGAAQVRFSTDDLISRSLVDVFILPPTMDELRSRLEGRATESEEQMDARLERARQEMEHWREYAHTIITGTREDDLASLRAIMAGERFRSARLTPPEGTGLWEK